MNNRFVWFLLWCLSISLIVISFLDFYTWAEGINTYSMYFLIGLIMVYLLVRSHSNSRVLWSFPLVFGVFVLTEFFNYSVFLFYPSTHYFFCYLLVFVLIFLLSMKLIKEKEIEFSFRDGEVAFTSFLLVIAVLVGYYMHWRA